MTYPDPIPSLKPEDYEIFLNELDEFEVSEEKEEQLQKHRDAINEVDN